MDNILSPEKLTHTWLEDALALLFGTLMISFGIILFRQAGALTGGTAGMAFLIHYAPTCRLAWSSSSLTCHSTGSLSGGWAPPSR
ncbi:membrane protein [Klebsiella pneumoniae subsp. ozaenae]|uniref:Membrane protein n=1 Tax=Klebsiella pneumoniae subsp. ozaenae TaxID=574 RepID=A0A377ZS99_KLEPO|nr:membrane protein [Klebsiella pneumoniae subsp. ozaenae]